MYYTKEEKLCYILDIVKKLKTFPSRSNSTINLYNDQYLFVEKFKKIYNKWLDDDKCDLQGFLYFEEINKYFEYRFPCNKNIEPLFVLRQNYKPDV